MQKSKYFGLPAPLRQSLGGVVIAWARIDSMIAELLSYMLHADPGSMYILNQDIAASTQLKWIRTLVEDKFTNQGSKDGLKILFDRIDVARVERNTYVHGLWYPGPDETTALVQTIKLSRVEIMRNELVTVADLDELFDDVVAIGDEFHDVLVALKVL